MITNVNSESDSINARPSTSSSRIPARAPGLRATASVAEAVARPWPRPQSPAAIPMPIPAAMAVSPAPVDASPVWAKAGPARNSTDSVMKRYCSLRILSPCFRRNCRQWVVEAHRAGPLTLAANEPEWKQPPARDQTLVLVGDCLGGVNQRQQHKNVGLNHGHSQVQRHKN